MLEIKAAWDLTVERGPNWLLVRAKNRAEDAEDIAYLVETLWSLMEEHFTYRLVLDLTDGLALDHPLIRQLVRLDLRARARDGCVRLCGLPRDGRNALRCSGLRNWLPVYCDRQEAVFGLERPR